MNNLKKVRIQEPYRAKLSENDLVVLDLQSDFHPTKPLLHKESRFLYVTSGRAKIKIQNEVYDMEKGAIIALNPWQISEIIEVESHVSYYLLIYKFDLFNFQIKKLFNINNEDFPFIETLYNYNKVMVPERDRNKILRLFEDIRNEIGICTVDIELSQRPYSDIYIFSRVSELLVYYLRYAQESKKPVSENNFISEEIFRYMFMNLSDDLSLGKLSKVFYMSESAISEYIKSITSLGFYELIQNMKMTKIEFLLLHTNMTLEEISGFLNFTDSAQLSKVFSEHTGMTTAEFKKINQSYSSLIDAHFDERSTKIIEYIYDNYDEDISILDISKLFNITTKNINKILKYYVEQNFHHFLSAIRVNRACDLLTNTELPIIDISLTVGYKNVKTFNRNFTSQIGMGPSDFRRLSRN